MYGIAVNDHTRNYIVKTHNEGVDFSDELLVETPLAVYIVNEDDTPNELVNLDRFYKRANKETDALYTRVTTALKLR